jgi:hypothetical protein
MTELVVNNINIVVERRHQRGTRNRGTRNHPAARQASPPVNAQLLQQVGNAAKQLRAISCSSSWMEDCLYRGKEYAPDFRCHCPRCNSKFPDRLHPQPARQSDYSEDCQVEGDEDAEFAEEFSRLRNARLRVGSAFIASRLDKNVGRSRRG